MYAVYMIARQLAIFPLSLSALCCGSGVSRMIQRQTHVRRTPPTGPADSRNASDDILQASYCEIFAHLRGACASRNPSVVITRKPAVSQLRVTGSATPRRLPRPARA